MNATKIEASFLQF